MLIADSLQETSNEGGCLRQAGEFTRLTVTAPGTYRIGSEYGPSSDPGHC